MIGYSGGYQKSEGHKAKGYGDLIAATLLLLFGRLCGLRSTVAALGVVVFGIVVIVGMSLIMTRFKCGPSCVGR